MIEPLKAAIIPLEGGDTFEFPYNPKEFTLTRNTGFQARNKGDGPWGGIHWDCAKPDELKFDVVLDVSEPEINLFSPMAATQLLPISSLASLLGYVSTKNVLDDIQKLIEFTMPGTVSMKLSDKTIDINRPPFVAFVWGDFNFFGGITTIDSKVVLFNPLGVPKRAEVSISMLGQAMETPGSADELAGYYGTSGYNYGSLSKFSTMGLMSADMRLASLAASLL